MSHDLEAEMRYRHAQRAVATEMAMDAQSEAGNNDYQVKSDNTDPRKPFVLVHKGVVKGRFALRSEAWAQAKAMGNPANDEDPFQMGADGIKPYIGKTGNTWELVDEKGKVVKTASSMEALQFDLTRLLASVGR